MIWAALLAVIYPIPGDAPAGSTKVPAPGVRYRMNMAMATSAPWVDSNIWRYRRDPKAAYSCDVREKSVQLAMAEAFAESVKVTLQTVPAQNADYDAMLAFLKRIPEGPTTPWADVAITEDGSSQAGEVLNLLSRRNLMFQLKGNIPVTSKITNPYEHVQEIREKLGDDNRLLRLFGSELTLAGLAREGNRIRLHLVNYGSRPVETLRIRIKGRHTEQNTKAYVFKNDAPRLSEFVYEGSYTELTLDKMPLYAVFDFR